MVPEEEIQLVLDLPGPPSLGPPQQLLNEEQDDPLIGELLRWADSRQPENPFQDEDRPSEVSERNSATDSDPDNQLDFSTGPVFGGIGPIIAEDPALCPLQGLPPTPETARASRNRGATNILTYNNMAVIATLNKENWLLFVNDACVLLHVKLIKDMSRNVAWQYVASSANPADHPTKILELSLKSCSGD